MSEKLYQPGESDAVLGGQAPTPVDGAVLGRLEGVKLRLASAVDRAQVTAALKEALKYGDAGLDLVIGAINHADRQVQRSAYLLLRERAEPQVKQALKPYKLWNGFERLYGLPCGHATIFTNRKVENFDPISGITDPVGTAYALRVSNGYYVYGGIEENITDKLELLLQDPKASEIEALVFGAWEYSYDSSKVVVDALVAAHEYLTSLKAVFIGDIEERENMISWIQQSDISPILSVYPNLEVLKVRGGTNLAFSPVRHNKLEALCIETGGLSRETVAEICALGLPSLEYLELWLGSHKYGGDSTIDDVMPIISSESFPKLKYLGLRNSEYSDDIALALVRSSLIERLRSLDLSMGTLGDEGAEALLNCPAVNQLDTLNVANNSLSSNMIQRLSRLDCQILAANQDYYPYEDDRYCSVSE